MKAPFIRTRRAGEFRARCRQTHWVPLVELLDLDPETTTSKWDKQQECAVFLVQCDFDTMDRAEFEAHVKDVHGGGSYEWDNASLSADVALVKSWSPRIRIPVKIQRLSRATPSGKPFKPSTRAIERDLRTCSGCGLVAQVDGTNGSKLWWDEHQRGCAVAQQEAS